MIPGRCDILPQGKLERMLLAMAVLGLIAGAVAGFGLHSAVPAEVRPLDPIVEVADARMTITRLRFEVGGRPASCFLTVYPDSATWRLEC